MACGRCWSSVTPICSISILAPAAHATNDGAVSSGRAGACHSRRQLCPRRRLPLGGDPADNLAGEYDRRTEPKKARRWQSSARPRSLRSRPGQAGDHSARQGGRAWRRHPLFDRARLVRAGRGGRHGGPAGLPRRTVEFYGRLSRCRRRLGQSDSAAPRHRARRPGPFFHVATYDRRRSAAGPARTPGQYRLPATAAPRHDPDAERRRRQAWVFGIGFAPEYGESIADFSDERAVELVREAAGLPDVAGHDAAANSRHRSEGARLRHRRPGGAAVPPAARLSRRRCGAHRAAHGWVWRQRRHPGRAQSGLEAGVGAPGRGRARAARHLRGRTSPGRSADDGGRRWRCGARASARASPRGRGAAGLRGGGFRLSLPVARRSRSAEPSGAGPAVR